MRGDDLSRSLPFVLTEGGAGIRFNGLSEKNPDFNRGFAI